MDAKDMLLTDCLQAAVEAEKKVIVLKRTVAILSVLCALMGVLWIRDHL